MANQSKTSIWIDGSQAGTTLKQIEANVRKLNNEIKQLPVNSDKYKTKLQELKAQSSVLKGHRDQIKGVGDSFGSAQKGIGGMLKQFAPIAGVAGAVGLAIEGVSMAVSSWYTNNKEMEKSLSSLRALTGASTQDIEFYKAAAEEMGRTSTVSAMQTVEAFKLIGSARPELLKNKEALAAVTKETITLSEASEMDMATSAQAMAGAMNQFNLSADQSSRIINTFAAGSKEGAAEVDDLTQSIDKFGTVASANNVTLEESVALTELMSEKNIKGSEAGTQLRNVLLNISTAASLSKEAQDAMAQYGVNLEVVQNKALPLEQRLREMAKVQGDQNALVKIFGKENVVAGATVLKNVDHLAKLTKAVTGTNTAYDQAAINTDNLDGDLKRLGSAWEGLTLSMDGGGNIFRPIVQDGADFLNWITDSTEAIQEWDTNKMETQFLKFTKLIPGVNLLFGDFVDEQIRINEMTTKAMDSMRDEADSVVVLTESLKDNNSALKNKNLTDEQAAEINAENERIIGVLNNRYPDLTKNMDLNKASASDLTKLQKDINDNLLTQSLNAVKAAEAERILGEIVQNSIAISEQRAKESKRWAITNFAADIFTDDAADMMETQDQLTQQLRKLPETMQAVENQIKDIDPQWGAAYNENSKQVLLAWGEIAKIEKKKMFLPWDEKALDAQIKGQKELISKINSENDKLKDKALDEQKRQEKIALAEEEAAKKREESAKKAIENYKKLKSSLESLLESTKKLKEDFDYTKQFDAFTDEQQKELFALEHSINEKYKKEIDSATELAKQKGKIGIQAQETLNTLLAIKEQDLVHEKEKINKKYLEEKHSAEYEAQQDANLKYLAAQESLEKTINELKVASAIEGVKLAEKGSFDEQKKAGEIYLEALKQQLATESRLKLEALMDQKDEGLITEEEFNLRKKQLNDKFNADVAASSEQLQIDLTENMVERIDSIASQMTRGLSMLQDAINASFEVNINNIERESRKSMNELERQYNQGIISKEQYDAQKVEIERKSTEQIDKIKEKQFEADKNFQMLQAGIAGALAIVQSYAQLGPIAGSIAAVFIGGVTALQLAAIGSKEYEAQQYAEGGYHNVVGAQDGKKYNAKYIGRHQGGMLPSSPSLALVSEKGPEYFVPYHLMQNQMVADSVGVIEAIRTNQFASGGFTSKPAGSSMNDNQLVQMLQMNIQMMSALSRQIPNMYARIDDGTIEDLQTRIDEINKFRN